MSCIYIPGSMALAVASLLMSMAFLMAFFQFLLASMSGPLTLVTSFGLLHTKRTGGIQTTNRGKQSNSKCKGGIFILNAKRGIQNA